MENGFGVEVRRERERQGLSLEALAERSGVSRAALSKIERGERNPSLQYALQIADALGRTLPDLVGHPGSQPDVVRATEVVRLVDENTGIAREALVELAPGSEIVRYTLPPNAASPPFRQHEPGTREAFVVLSGAIQLVAGDAHVDLAAGDSAVLPGDRPHHMRNLADHDSVALLVLLRHPSR